MNNRESGDWLWEWAWLFLLLIFMVYFIAERFERTDARIDRLETQVKLLTSK